MFINFIVKCQIKCIKVDKKKVLFAFTILTCLTIVGDIIISLIFKRFRFLNVESV